MTAEIPNREQIPPKIRDWSRGEEMASGLSHGVAFLAALIGAPFLLIAAIHHGGSRAVIGVSIFAASTLLLYFSSALHHWLLAGRAKDVLEVLDHAAIYLVIAGTYMPFAVGILWGPWGWLLMGIVWPLAIFGVLLITTRGLQPRLFTVSLYVAMGLLFFIAIRPLAARLPTPGLLLLFAGCAAYLVGLLFYFARRFHYHHLAWHLSVLAGTAFHYFAVLRYSF